MQWLFCYVVVLATVVTLLNADMIYEGDAVLVKTILSIVQLIQTTC